jgi:pentatricopeptide repeat protein
MLDLLARAGRLEDALKLLKQMPFEPNESAVNTVLGACQKWKDLEAAQEVFDYAIRLDQRHAGTFVLMSNIYADFDMREESLKLKEIRKQLECTRTWDT